MKSQERHKLKENEFARTVEHAREVVVDAAARCHLGRRGRRGVARLVGGYTWWRSSTRGTRRPICSPRALAVYQAPVVPPAAPAPGSPPPVQQPGTYLTEQAKLEAALPKFIEAADKYPSSDAGITARYHAAAHPRQRSGATARPSSAFRKSSSRAGIDALRANGQARPRRSRRSRRRSTTARSRIYTELSRDTASQMPVDGVLMQLGRAYALAGKKGRSGPRLHPRDRGVPAVARTPTRRASASSKSVKKS